jgi:hypothetical protein
MRYIIAIVLLVLTLGLAQGIPLQGGNDNVTAFLFNAIRFSPAENQNETILELDLTLQGTDNAKFELIDSKDNVYSPVLSRNLENGRKLLYFKIPEYALFKLFRVMPPEGGPININWWETPKGTRGDLILRYYGLIEWINGAPSGLQGVIYQVSLFNQSSSVPVTLDNFTILDQWRWPYMPTNIKTLENGRIDLIFENLSPLSKPTVLVYDYTGPNEIFINLENDLKPLPDSKVYGGNATTSQPSGPQVKDSPKAIVTPTTQTSPKAIVTPTTQASPKAIVTPTTQATPKASSLKDETATIKNRQQNVTGSSKRSQRPSISTQALAEEIGRNLEKMSRP